MFLYVLLKCFYWGISTGVQEGNCIRFKKKQNKTKQIALILTNQSNLYLSLYMLIFENTEGGVVLASNFLKCYFHKN